MGTSDADVRAVVDDGDRFERACSDWNCGVHWSRDKSLACLIRSADDVRLLSEIICTDRWRAEESFDACLWHRFHATMLAWDTAAPDQILDALDSVESDVERIISRLSNHHGRHYPLFSTFSQELVGARLGTLYRMLRLAAYRRFQEANAAEADSTG